MTDVAGFLGRHPPFDALDTRQRERLAAAVRERHHVAGEVIVDGFAQHVVELTVVVSGEVGLWNRPVDAPHGMPETDPDEILGVGGVFGYLSLLTRAASGPRAVALTNATVLALPSESVQAVFSTMAGAQFLAGQLQFPRRVVTAPTRGTVDELIRTTPAVGTPGMTVAEAARVMTDRGRDHLVVPGPDGALGILTDVDIRARLVAQGLPPSTPVAQIMTQRARTVLSGTPATEGLLLILEHDLTGLPVVDSAGRLLGVVGPGDFVSAPGGATVGLRAQIRRAASVPELAEHARRMPWVLGELVRRGQPSHEITTVLSLVHDAMVRRALELALDDAPELDGDRLTWLSLGSNARREAVLSSDVDSAVAFDDSLTDPAENAAYRAVFARVDDILRDCGLEIDPNGAIASSALFARTHAQWRAAAGEWLRAPLENKGMIMTSLMLDERPIWGDRGLSEVTQVFSDLRSHPSTLRLLLAESLSHRARIRSARDVLVGRGGTFDIKTHALTPLINIARWAALSVESTELDTRSRLRAAAGTPMLTEDNASTLVEVFDVLQKVRLSYQVAQLDRAERVGDVITMRRLSPLDRGLVGQAVREISSVQRRMATVSHYTPLVPED
ncbi:DUF294 nucleotidyltransferase-like domain-containing protein [Williamsia deligens]|uniref:DUF294 nucleotidyltransferase-like domain-containing protein n=1 Tax=Williamsia deligens TaxID=321325 RepID=A0ABW3GFW1_9NOCA|nr:DUF294 nucleotidyltransferase-like domain-containing protein [Williamsia deligens]